MPRASIAVASLGVLLGSTACMQQTPGATSSTTPGPTALSVGCHDGVDSGVGDIRYDGPIDTFHNGAYVYSTDGTCSAGSQPLTFVVANTPAEASTKCSTIDPGTQPFHLQYEYGVPAGNWYCFS